MEATDICLCESAYGDCRRRTACVLRSVLCRNRTTPSEQRPQRFIQAIRLEGTKVGSEQFNRDEDGTLSRDKMRIRERWAGFCHRLLNTKSLKLNTTIIDLLPPRPPKLSLNDELSMDEMTEALKGMPNWKAVGPDGLPPELLNIDQPAFAQCFQNILVNVWVI